jgi:hypothetical protein
MQSISLFPPGADCFTCVAVGSLTSTDALMVDSPPTSLRGKVCALRRLQKSSFLRIFAAIPGKEKPSKLEGIEIRGVNKSIYLQKV